MFQDFVFLFHFYMVIFTTFTLNNNNFAFNKCFILTYFKSKTTHFDNENIDII